LMILEVFSNLNDSMILLFYVSMIEIPVGRLYEDRGEVVS